MLSALSLLYLCFESVSARPNSYAVWAADSAIARGQGAGLKNGSAVVSYEHGEFQWGFRGLYEATGNQSYYDYIKQGVDRVVSDDGKVVGDYKYVTQNTLKCQLNRPLASLTITLITSELDPPSSICGLHNVSHI